MSEHEFDQGLRDDDTLGDLSDLPQTETEKLLRRVLDIIESARPVPLSTSAMINKEEVVALLEQALHHFPEELRESRWLLKERTEFLNKARADGEELIGRARARAEQMVQRSEVVRAAESRARQIVDAAEADARRMRLECEDYCDKKLGSFEIVLERTMKLVAQGREKLQLSTSRMADEYDTADASEPARNGRGEPPSGFFDQDQA
ncbi:MAG: hypothetical protein AB7W59_01575 [Acidimicrobiia bacterium]